MPPAIKDIKGGSEIDPEARVAALIQLLHGKMIFLLLVMFEKCIVMRRVIFCCMRRSTTFNYRQPSMGAMPRATRDFQLPTYA